MFGMTLYEMFSRNWPFSEVVEKDGVSGIPKMVLAGKRPALPEDWPPALKCLIQECWN